MLDKSERTRSTSGVSKRSYFELSEQGMLKAESALVISAAGVVERIRTAISRGSILVPSAFFSYFIRRSISLAIHIASGFMSDFSSSSSLSFSLAFSSAVITAILTVGEGRVLPSSTFEKMRSSSGVYSMLSPQ